MSADKNIENSNNQLKYAIIRSEKGTITMFEVFFEGHSTDSADIRSLGAANPIISYFLLQLAYSTEYEYTVLSMCHTS